MHQTGYCYRYCSTYWLGVIVLQLPALYSSMSIFPLIHSDLKILLISSKYYISKNLQP